MAFKSSNQATTERPLEKDFNPFIGWHQSREGKKRLRFLPESLDSLDPEEPVIAHDLWLDVQTLNGPKKYRLWVNSDLSEHVEVKTRCRVMFQVYDRTPVIKADNTIFYPNLKMQYPVQSTNKPTPNNRIMLLEMSYGLFKDLNTMDEGTHFDDEGNARRLVEFDVIYQRTGTKFDDTTYTVTPSQYFHELTEAEFNADRYDLDRYMFITPNDRIFALLKGKSWEAVMSDLLPKIDFFPKVKAPF